MEYRIREGLFTSKRRIEEIEIETNLDSMRERSTRQIVIKVIIDYIVDFGGSDVVISGKEISGSVPRPLS